MDYDETLARMRAEMMLQGRQPQVYDDGASQLSQDPNMLQVGLFGKRPPVVPPPVVAEPPINLARRSILGLRPTSNENLPAVRPQDIPPPAAAPVPITQAPTPDLGSFDPGKGSYDAPSALGALVSKAAATPMSRREVLQRAGQAALNHALPTPKIADVAPEIAAPLTQMAKVAEPVVIGADAAAKIAAYASTIWKNSDNAKKAYEASTGQSIGDEWDDPENVPHSQLWASVEEGNNYTDAAKAVGLDAETVAAQTKLPLATVKELIGDGSKLLGEVAGVSNTRNSLEDIMEDGRSKEAARTTSYLDIWDNDKFLDKAAKKAVKEEGKDADDMDVYNNFINQVVDRFREMERGHSEYNSKSGHTEYKKQENTLSNELHKHLIDNNILDDIWGRASEQFEPDFNDVLERMSKHGWTGPVDNK